jgi:hypothetical protein
VLIVLLRSDRTIVVSGDTRPSEQVVEQCNGCEPSAEHLRNAGHLDELSIDVAAVLLDSGVRLFNHLAITPAALGNPKVIAGVGVTHLRHPVRKA